MCVSACVREVYVDVFGQAYGFVCVHERVVRGLLGKPEKLDLLLFLERRWIRPRSLP